MGHRGLNRIPALTALEPFVGTWSMKGHLLGSDEDNIIGDAVFEWLPGGFFLRHRISLRISSGPPGNLDYGAVGA